MEEIKVIVKQDIGNINFNYDEIKAKAEEISKLYSGIVVTEDTIKLAKEDMANLRKLVTEIDAKRKEIKKDYNKPLDLFETKVKEIIAIINKPINELDIQYKEFESNRKAEKRKEIEAIYYELIGDLKEFAPLSSFYDPRWENAGTTIKSIRESIESYVSSTELAVNTIKGMTSDAKDKALNIFKETMSLAKAIAYINDYEVKKAQILAKQKEDEERKKQEEARRAAAEEERLRQEALAKVEEVKKPLTANEIFAASDNEDEEFQGFDVIPEPVKAWQTIEVFGTANDFAMVKQILHHNGFTYRGK